MTAPSSFKQADLKRALKAAISAGLEPKSCRISSANGDIEVQFLENVSSSINSFDALIEEK